MIEFIIDHPGFLGLAIGVLVDIVVTIILCFRKEKCHDKDFIVNSINEMLPGCINLAEESGVDGSSKLSMVLELVLAKVKRFICKKDLHYYKALIVEKVEAILSTPQKKEK